MLSSSDNEKQLSRPETLLFQHVEDICTSRIAKSSLTTTSLNESSITPGDSKINSENLSVSELSTISSKHIATIENTVNKYDSMINQISNMFATVSPLSSSANSVSSDMSALNYELLVDGSPILRYKPIVSHSLRQSSYGVIVITRADLHTELTQPSDIQQATMIIEEGKDKLVPMSLGKH